MNAAPNTLMALFQVEGRFVAPLYQRPYSWDTEQWEPFWHAVSSTADRQLGGLTVRPYFLGAMVLDQLRVPTGELAARQIIDGQQRLVTLQLCLAAVRDLCTEGPQAAYGELLRRMTFNDAPDLSARDRFKVWPTNIDRDAFEQVMTARSAQAVRGLLKKLPDERHRLLRGYLHLEEQARTWLAEPGHTPARRIQALWDTFSQHLIVVTIDLHAQDDAQQIFETLNALGLPLLPADLVKNYLLREAEAQHLDVDSLYERYWQEFDRDEAYWRQKVTQGRLTRPRIDIFLQHYTTMRIESDVLTTQLFGAFREWAADSGMTVPEQLSEFQLYAGIFRSWDDPNSDYADFFKTLSALDTTTAYPLLLELFRRHSDNAIELRVALAHIESYLVRRAVAGLTAKAYNRVFLSLLVDISKAGDFSAARLSSWLLDQEAETNRWPTDDEFEYAWLRQPIYKRQRQGRIRLILERLEHAMRSSKSEAIEFRKSLSIEHLMPQSWVANWPLPVGNPIAAKARRDVLVQTIGNLTLLTQPLNSDVSNGAWLHKRPQIEKYSLLKLNRDWPTNWDEDEIEARSLILSSLAHRIWPRPSGPKDDRLWKNPEAGLGGAGQNWRRAETVLAYDMLRSSEGFPPQAQIEALADEFERTAGSVGMKLHNLRAAESFGDRGLPRRSAMDDAVVAEYRDDLPGLHAAADLARKEIRRSRS